MTDKMLIAGAKKLASLAPALKDPDDALLPPFGGESRLLCTWCCLLMRQIDAAKVNFEVALAVMDQAVEEGIAQIDVAKDKRREWAEKARWTPEYDGYEFDPKGLK